MVCSWQKKNGFYSLAGLDREIIAAFTTREFYPAFKEDQDYMIAERKRFLAKLALEINNLVCPIQSHSINAFQVFSTDKGKGAFGFDDTLQDVDILLTNERGPILSIFTADCLPLFIYDFSNRAVCLAHVGWRGLAQGAVSAAISKLQKAYSSKPEELIFGIGPAIRGCCYEVSPPVTNYFKKYLLKRENRDYLDIPQVVCKQLIELGAAEENIFDSGFCTCCKNDEFFSYRKEGDQADRMISIITLR